MYRAKLFLHPHTHHQKTSTVPGAYPSVIKTNSNNDYTRTIQLSSEKPSAAIGRSSRNEAKALFAGPNNGFFESPVMSRFHAEVRMVLSPHRKIIIQDTKSMHGTFVNGLQLHPNETAELQEGTEVTFGAEVTRGDEVYPAKTFRCEVQWERMRSPSPVAPKARIGYGVTSQDLEYESGEDEDDMYDEEDMEEHSEDGSSGRESSPASPWQMENPFGKTPEPTRNSYMRNEEIPEIHERSTKNTLNLDGVRQAFELRSAKLMDLIDNELRANSQDDKPRQRMSTIHNLVNKTQSDNTEKPMKVIDLIDVDEQDEDALKIIDRPASFNAEKKVEQPSTTSKPLYIDLAQEDSDMEIGNDDVIDLYSDESDAGSEMGEDEDVEEEEEEVCQKGSEHKSTTPKQTESVPGSSESADPPTNLLSGSAGREQVEKEEEVPETRQKAPENQPTPNPKPAESVPVSSEPASPPEVMSSKAGAFYPWPDLSLPRQPVSLPPPIGKPNGISTLQQYKDHLQQQAGGLHTRWIPNGQGNITEAKREFFSSRADNFAKVSAQMNHGGDKTPSPFTPPSAAHDRWSESLPLAPPEWFQYHSTPVPKAMDEFLPPNQNYASILKSLAGDFRKKEADEKTEEKPAEEKQAEDIAPPAPEQDECEQDTEVDEEDGDFEDNYYCDMETENDEDGMDDLFDEPPPPPKTNEAEANKNAAYSKFSIDDMMNHESPKGKRAITPAVFASPPPSEGSADCGPEAVKPPVLENILNPAAAATPPSMLKRKRAVMEEPIVAPPRPVFERADAPEVVVMDVSYPELVVDNTDEPRERPVKRAKKANGTSFVKLATAAMAGAVMGGVGMFAALVASAQ